MRAGSRLHLQSGLARKTIERLRLDPGGSRGIEHGELRDGGYVGRIQPFHLIPAHPRDKAQMVVAPPLLVTVRRIAAHVAVSDGDG